MLGNRSADLREWISSLKELERYEARLTALENEFLLKKVSRGSHGRLEYLGERILRHRVDSLRKREDMLSELQRFDRTNARKGAGPASVVDGGTILDSPVSTNSATVEAVKEVAEPEICVVDLEKFCKGDVVCRLPCFHVFHKDCILPHLRNQEMPRCPIDRTPVKNVDIDRLPVWKWDLGSS